jgi:hypothetical protein
MSDPAELLAIRKELLVARSSLYRLRIGRDLARVRESVSPGSVGSAIAGSAPARELVLGLLLSGVGGGRVSRLVRLAGRALVVARLALAAFGMLRSTSQSAQAATPEPPGVPPA